MATGPRRRPGEERDEEARESEAARRAARRQARTEAPAPRASTRRDRGRGRDPNESAQTRRRRRSSDLLARILVAVPAAIVAIVFVDVGGVAFAVLMAVVSVLCLLELYRMLDRWRPVPIVGYAAAVALVVAARYGTDRTVLELTMVALPVIFLAVAAANQDGMPTLSIAGTMLGIVWIGLAFAHAELLRRLAHGNAILIDVMVGTFLADVGAYFGGRMFGRRPLAPSISPNKTVEGLGLGMFTAIVAVFVAGRFQQTWMTEGNSLLLGLAVAVLGPIGDLLESVVKRDAGVKDSGTLFGAHGGALDRLDAIIFTVVGGYYVWVSVLH